jgi:uncharacterized coiled-coil protein SlyX
MTIDERVDKIERSLGAQDVLVRELRDAVTVTAELEARQARILNQHALWLEESDRRSEEHDRRMAEHDSRMGELDDRIAKLVSGFGEFMRRDRP